MRKITPSYLIQFLKTIGANWWCVFRTQIWNFPDSRLRIFISVAMMGITIWIGLAYAGDGAVQGWQLLTWAAAILILTLVLTPALPLTSIPRWTVPLAGLFLVALLLRVFLLDFIPGLLHIDETGVAQFAHDMILRTPGLTTNPFITGPSSQPTLHHYILSISMKIFGANIFGLRFTSALAGAIGVGITFLMINTLHDQRLAWITTILMTSYHFAIHYSRIGLNNIWDTIWIPLLVYGFVKGWKTRWAGGAVLTGLAIGLSQYFYAGSKIGIFLVFFLVIWHWKEDESLARKLVYLGRIIAVSVTAAAPILIFALKFPLAYLDRTNQVWGWKPEAIEIITGETVNYWKWFWHQVQYSLGTYTIYPDPSGFYGPGVPLLFGFAAVLFLAGIGFAIYKKCWIPLLWLALTTFFGGFLLGVANSSSHYVVAIPAICWLVALPIEWIWNKISARLAVSLIILIVISDLYFYFVTYLNSPPRDFVYPFPLIH